MKIVAENKIVIVKNYGGRPRLVNSPDLIKCIEKDMVSFTTLAIFNSAPQWYKNVDDIVVATTIDRQQQQIEQLIKFHVLVWL
jgi:hypothetical protein